MNPFFLEKRCPESLIFKTKKKTENRLIISVLKYDCKAEL